MAQPIAIKQRTPEIIRIMNQIGKDVHRCPSCGGILSHDGSGYYCRCCKVRGIVLIRRRKEREA